MRGERRYATIPRPASAEGAHQGRDSTPTDPECTRGSAPVFRPGGALDKFLGDGIMAFFGGIERLESPRRSPLGAHERSEAIHLQKLAR